MRTRDWRRYRLEITFKNRIFRRLSNWYMYRPKPYKTNTPTAIQHMGETYFYLLKYTNNYFKTNNPSYGKNNHIYKCLISKRSNTRSKQKKEFRNLLIENGLA